MMPDQPKQQDDASQTRSDMPETEITQGTPKPETDGRETDSPSVPASTDEVLAQVPSEKSRLQLLAGAAIGYRIVVFAVIFVFALALAGYLIFRLTHVLELFVIGLVIAMAINPIVRLLEKRGVPRIASVVTLLALLAAGFAGLIASVGPP